MLDTRQLAIPIVFSQSQRSWPKHGDAARGVPYLPLALALRQHFRHDAHTAAYSTPTFPRRLSAGALLALENAQLPEGVPMVLALFDVDCEASHKATRGTGDLPSPDEWWLGELAKLDVLVQEHPDPFIYRTRGGYRLVYILPEPYLLRSPDDAALWSFRYLTWCAYLARRFDIHADPSCKDWQRLYRLPHATRTPGRHPEEHDVLGAPRHIGIWHCEPSPADVIAARTLSKRTLQAPPKRERRVVSVGAGKGLLYYAFQARGWVGQEVEPGKIAVVCPWEDLHTKGERFDTSTVLFLPEGDDTVGWLHCAHAHCQGRDLHDVLAMFTTAELERARHAAGLPTFSAKSGGWPSHIIVEVA